MKHRGEILNIKKEDLIALDGSIRYPAITYEEFVKNWLPNDIIDERQKQYWYKKEMAKVKILYKRYFPDFEIPKGENAPLIAQGIMPLEQNGRPIK